MYKEILRSIAGVGLFPVVSLLLFVTVFVTVVLRVARMDQSETQRLAGLPLEGLDEPAAARKEVCQ